MIHRDSIEFTTALALGAVLGVSLAYLFSSAGTDGAGRTEFPRLVARTRVGGDVEVRLRTAAPGGARGAGRVLLRRLAEARGSQHSGGNGRRG